jgi:hypothetical protein
MLQWKVARSAMEPYPVYNSAEVAYTHQFWHLFNVLS